MSTTSELSLADRGYVHPEILVSTEWVAQHLSDPDVRLVESNEDLLLYPSGHIQNAVQVDWTSDLNHQVVRDYLGQAEFEKLCSRIGITPDTTVVFYGDKSNWWAAYALWVFSLFGHKKVKLMDGGRLKWEKEKRAVTREIPKFTATDYKAAHERDDETIRALRDVVMQHVKAKKPLVDVRSPLEFTGERLHMEDYPNEAHCAAVTSRAPKACPGPSRSTPRTALLKRRTNCARSSRKSRACSRKTTWWSTAASASAAA